jgi:hypothetical protein
VAQLVAHLHGMQGVRGSSPLRSTVVLTGLIWPLESSLAILLWFCLPIYEHKVRNNQSDFQQIFSNLA